MKNNLFLLQMLVPRNRSMVVIIAVIIFAAILDTSILSVSVYTGGLNSSINSYILFSTIAITYAVGQYFILLFIKSKIEYSKKNRFILKVHKFLYITQFVLIGIIVIIICQMILFGSYASILLKSVAWINYIIASILFGFIGIKLFLWDRLNRNFVLISYSIALIGLSAACISTAFYVTNQLEGGRGFDYIFPMKSTLIVIAGADNNFSLLYTITSVSSFVLIWIATVLLLRHYSSILGRAKYWIMVVIPLAYFLTQYQSFIPDLFEEFHVADPISYGIAYTLFFNMSKPIGGILFGLAFWSVTKSVRKSVIKDYMTISGYGIMLFFTVNQPVSLTLIPYPPFGITTICFVGLSSYLVIIGIYSSALSIASDSELLKTARKLLPYKSNLLGNIGSAQEIQKIHSKALEVIDKLSYKINEETGVQSSLEDQDIKDYLKEILEIKEKDRNLHDI